MYNSNSGLLYLLVQRGNDAVIYAIIESDYPDLQLVTKVTSDKVGSWYTMMIKDDLMFMGGAVTSNEAGWIVKTTRFMNDTQNPNFVFSD